MKRILFPTDFSANSINAIHFGLSLYEDREKYILLHTFVIPYSSIEVADSMSGFMGEKVEHQLFQLEEKINTDFPNLNLDIETEFETGNLISTIKKYVKEEEIKMIVMGTLGASGISEKIMGTQSTAVIKNVDCPVLIVPGGAKSMKMDKIILAVDNEQSFEKVDFLPLVELAKRFSSKIMVLHFTKEENGRIEGEAKISEALKGIDHSFYIIRNTNVINGLDEFADEHNASLLVMLVHKTNFFESIFQGSTTKKIALHTTIPLLALHQQK